MTSKLLVHFAIAAILCTLVFQPAMSQSGDSLRLPGIPHPLFWYNTPAQYNVRNGVLQITAGPKTDMFRDPNVTYNTDNAPKLLFEADEDFVLSASIYHPFLSKWDGGALVLIEDSLNWIKFCFEKDYTGARRVVSVVTKDISDDCNSAALLSGKVYYKMAKAGNVITLYYSTDNKKWLLIRHLQFNNKKKIRIGFLAQSPTGHKCQVSFSDIRYEQKKIKDPYIGE